MRGLATAVLAVAAVVALLAAKGGVDFTSEQFFRFGMDQADAEGILQNEENWKIMYRVDTTQTADIACVYQGTVYYQLGFYKGRCYSLEKRAELPLEQVDPVFEFYKGKLGETPEAARSQDQKLMFARWSMKDREISVTGSERESGIYMLTYEEQDPIAAGDARHAQEQELGSAPQEVDPITGKPRPVTQTGGGEQQAGQAKNPPKQDGGKDKDQPPPRDDDDSDGDGGIA
jgi:hypothetical protein